MGIALFALFGVLIAAYMLLYKMGLIGTLACGTGSCGVVQNSSWAVFLGLPVPAWGVGGYGIILAAALLGVQPAWAQDRRVGLALFASSSIAFGFSLYLTALEAFVIHAWCRWCIASAAVATVIFLLSLAELRRPRSMDR
jgi:uncharacterized membrane protein